MVNKIIGDYAKTNRDYKITISGNSFNFIGGIRVKSADGLMGYDGTIDSKVERIKPIIRKNIAQLLRG
jgi:vacuolar-type H+-ATPase subunit E/Vma4